jgi:hypothetical protein
LYVTFALVTSRAERIAVLREVLASKLLVIVLLLVLPLGLASAPRTFDDGDVSWHVAAGQWMLHHAKIPTADPFSFTAAGHPWVAMEWLADLVYASAFNMASYAGLAAVVAGALIVLHAVLFLHLQRFLGPLGLAAIFIAMDVVLAPFMLARPHVLVWPVMAGWTVLLLRAAEQQRAPPVWGALLMLVWTNLHASFPLGALIGAGIALDALIKTRWRTLPEWTVFALASLLAMLLNANGAEGLIRPFYIAGLKMLPLIQEWQPSTPSSTPQFYAVLLLGLGALLWSGVRVPIGRLALLLVMLGMAFSQVRHQSWFIIVAAAVLPPLLGRIGETMARAGIIWLAAIPLLAVRAIWPLTPPESPATPRQLIASVPHDLRNQPVLNGYTFGGPLILAGIKPYIDGRAEIYGDDFVINYSQIIDGDVGRFNRAVARYGIRWTILPPSNARLIAALDSSKNWRRIYSSDVGVIHARRN